MSTTYSLFAGNEELFEADISSFNRDDNILELMMEDMRPYLSDEEFHCITVVSEYAFDEDDWYPTKSKHQAKVSEVFKEHCLLSHDD